MEWRCDGWGHAMMPATSLMLASVRVGPVQFDAPIWLLLIPVLWVFTVLIGRRTISGLGGATRVTALVVRLLVIALLAGAMAEPNWRRESKDVSVTVLIDASKSIPGSVAREIDQYVDQARGASKGGGATREERLGVVTAAKSAYVQVLPSRLARKVERVTIGAEDGTDLASGLRLAMAVLPEDAANRIVIASDGNETVGSLFQAAEAAKAAGIPIDVLPLKYKYDAEVILDKLVAPANARRGENITLRAVLNATRATRGRLSVQMNGEPVDLDPDSTTDAAVIDLRAGVNVVPIPVTAARTGPQRFEAVFEPLRETGTASGDTIAENNRAMAVTFVGGEGRVLVLSSSTEESSDLVKALREAKLDVSVASPESGPSDLTDLNAYECVVLVNTPAYAFSIKQQDDLKQYIHDSGGGLVMVGGPDSFGAGGWIGSPIEDALPIRLDPPQKRNMPRGALVLVIHSVEIPQGVFFGRKVCEAAAGALSRLDLIGITEYGNGGTVWTHPLSLVGDGSLVRQRVNNLQFGDMPDFAPSLDMAYRALNAADAGQKHCIVISDGDPALPSNALLQRFRDSKISISTVGIGVHGVNEQNNLKKLSQPTGGRHYDVTGGDVTTLPQIFIKEAQTVRRSLIWEGTPFVPTVTGGASESMRGIGASVPPIGGYVVAAEREGLTLVTLRGKENDPILAQWQYGLGKSVAFTSDATSRWASAWIGWPQYRAFWEQHVRWAMRPGGSASTKVVTENRGDETLIVVEAVDPTGERLNFANFQGRLALPGGEGQDITLRQVGPGRYEGVVPTDRPGSYIATLRYTAPGKDGATPLIGTVQAAVSRPFADEYRALEDNTPLLRQVAEFTGGRVLTFDPQKDDLWNQKGLKFPVATRPIWLYVALAAITLFLADVGVRRVRIDVRKIARSAAGVFKRSKAVKAGEIGNLRGAREQARERLRARSSTPEGGAAPAASRKFEADRSMPSAELNLEKPGVPIERGPSKIDSPKPAAGSEEQGMSALLKAKKRARDEMGEQDKG
jgi:uncharacterized membrane protein